MEAVIGQYPFFQQDQGANQNRFYTKARKATDAEWKLLARYNGTRQQQNIAGINEAKMMRQGYKINGHLEVTEEMLQVQKTEQTEWINPRLRAERNSDNKVSVT